MAGDQAQRATSKWTRISQEIKLNENIINRNSNNVIYPLIFQFQEVSVDFIRENIDIIRDQNLWDIISQYQTLDLDFILEFREDLNWSLILLYQNLTDPYLPREHAEIQNVTGTTEFSFFVDKSDINLSFQELSDVTNFEIQSSTTASNNKVYLITSVDQTDDQFIIRSSDTFTTGSTREGWLFLQGTGTGENTTTFLENSDIEPFLHRNNNTNRPFRDNLSRGQILSETFIINNITDLNIPLICQYQNLSDFFVLRRSTDSTFPDAEANIAFDWDQLTINQDFTRVWEEPDYTNWVKDKVNSQLLLRYQNLSRDFIFANSSDLQLFDVGRFNRNLSDADLQQLEDNNPGLTETTDRPGSVRFNYTFGDIRNDLQRSGFQFENGRPVGYVFYHRNGRIQSNNKIRFNQEPGTILNVSQVNLNSANPNSRSGITVSNGDNLVRFEDRQAFKIAKVGIDIVPRDIDQNATGSILMAPKINYINTDRIIIPDGINTRTLEFDLTGTGEQFSDVCYSSFPFLFDNNIATSLGVNHRLETGSPITVSGTPPPPLMTATTYYVISLSDNTFRLASSLENAMANIALNVNSGIGTLFRTDNRLASTNDMNLYNGLPIHFRGPGTNPGGINSNQIYYVIKKSKYTFSVAESLQNAEDGIEVALTTLTSNKTVTVESIPINLRSSDIVRANDIATVFGAAINNLYEVTVSGAGSFSQFGSDPFYPRVKSGQSIDISEFQDYSTTFTADQNNNRFTLNSILPINNGDPVTLTGTLPTPLNSSTVYYAIRISNNEFELADTLENANSRFSINLQSSGNGTIFPLRVDLNDSIGINTGNRVEVSGTTLPTGLVANTVYYIRKITETRIEFCTTIDNAFDGVPIAIRKSGNDPKTLTANDHNIIFDTTKLGITHFADNDKLYVEFFDEIAEVSDSVVPRGTGTSFTVTSVVPLLNISTNVDRNTINLTSTLPSNQKSLANQQIRRFTNDLNSVRVQGLDGGFEDTILDRNARGVGVVFPVSGNLRAFSVTILDNDWYQSLRF